MQVSMCRFDPVLSCSLKELTNAHMEGFNNKIRWLIRQAYGYRDREYFYLKIYDLPKLKTTTEL